jgi:hypothetical protein
VPGFLPPYEVTRIVRSAGFDPLAPPLREGTAYVLRATDFRGILMRVVVDGHSGAIRAVNRIVAATDNAAGMIPPYGAPPYGVPPYGAPIYRGPPVREPYAALPPDGPTGYDGAEFTPVEPEVLPPPPPPHARAATRPWLPNPPPLPRPRPASLVSHKDSDDGPTVKPAASPQTTSAVKPDSRPNTKPDPKPDAKAGTAATTTPAAVPGKDAPAPLND